MKYFKAFMLAIGIGMDLFAIYIAVINYNEENSFEKADAVVTEFVPDDDFQSRDNGLVAIVGFVYKGDSIHKNTGYYTSGMEVGKHYTIVFPKDQPEKAEMQQSLWTVPLFLLGFGTIFFIGPVWLIRLDEKRRAHPKVVVPRETKAPTWQEKLTGRLVFTFLGAGFTWTSVYLFKSRLANPSGDVDWGLVMIVGLVALLLDFIVLAIWVGVILESQTVEADADFVKVIPENLTSRNPRRWKIECKWQDILTGEWYTWTSTPLDGVSLFYNRQKIRVTYHPRFPKFLNTVDLSFVSKKNDHGIVLVDQEVIDKASAEAERYQKENKDKVAPTRQPSKAMQLLVKGGVILVILLLVGWWSYSCDDSGMRIIEEPAAK